MAGKRPLFTENFSTNLGDIETFLGAEGAGYFAKFFNRLTDEIVSQVCRFPRSGRSFLERSINTTQAERLAQRLRRRLQKGEDIRELIVDDFLILYLVREELIVFLSIKHHRQLSYDLKTFWRE